jgi:hypothetical protein
LIILGESLSNIKTTIEDFLESNVTSVSQELAALMDIYMKFSDTNPGTFYYDLEEFLETREINSLDPQLGIAAMDMLVEAWGKLKPKILEEGW